MGIPLEPAPQPIGLTNRQKAVNGLILIFAVGIVVVACLKAWLWAGVFNAEAMGYALGGMFLPLLFQWPFFWLANRRRKNPPDRAKQWLLITGVALGFLLLTLPGEYTSAQQRKAKLRKDIAAFIHSALSGVPSEGKEKKWHAPMREFIAQVVEFNREYVEGASKFATPEMAGLYSPASYATPAKIRETIAQLQQMLEFAEQHSSIEPLFDRLRTRIRATDWSASEKSSLLEGVDRALERISRERGRVFDAEKVWIVSSIDLYQHALSNHQYFRVREDQIVITDSEVLKVFNERVDQANERRSKFDEAAATFLRFQKETLSEVGVSPSDFLPSKN